MLVRIEGMHCYRCEDTLRSALVRQGGIFEVEVDFPSSQCSVLFDPVRGEVDRYTDAIRTAGYRVASITLLHAPQDSERADATFA
jgi:copper chaperone CopZ